MTWVDALAVGIAQAFAIIPGVSRSGVTLTTARFRTFGREALRVSRSCCRRRLSPALPQRKAGSCIKRVFAEMRLPYLVGIAVSGSGGFACYRFLYEVPETPQP